MKKEKTFIFDLDGVIVDTARYHYQAWQKLAQELGVDFTPEHNEQLKGVSRVRSLDIILELGNLEATQAQKNVWLHQKNQDYLSYLVNVDESEILPGVMAVLLHLKEKNQKIVLGSASKNARPILEKTGILPLFDAIVDGNDVTNAKPDPEVFMQGAVKVGSTPLDCIVFEDSVAGVQAANIASMTSVGIGEAAVLKEAKFVFPSFSYIDTQFIDNLINN
jgi:beta-phosphoglucomutase